jgi:type IV fimbrial biogenesis protein FimT
MNWKSSRGFTALELMIAVAVLALLASMSVPAMTTAIERRQTVAVVERIYGELQLARSAAVARSEPVFMNISAGNDWAVGVSNNAACDPADNEPACELPDVNGNNAITHRYSVADNDNVSLGASANQISFFPQRGTATATNLTITSNGRRGYIVTIIVRPLGQVSICSPGDNPATRLNTYRECG